MDTEFGHGHASVDCERSSSLECDLRAVMLEFIVMNFLVQCLFQGN